MLWKSLCLIRHLLLLLWQSDPISLTKRIILCLTISLQLLGKALWSRPCCASGCQATVFYSCVMWQKFFKLIILMGDLDPGLLSQSIQKYLALVCLHELCAVFWFFVFFACAGWVAAHSLKCAKKKKQLILGESISIVASSRPLFILHCCFLLDKFFYKIDCQFSKFWS